MKRALWKETYYLRELSQQYNLRAAPISTEIEDVFQQNLSRVKRDISHLKRALYFKVKSLWKETYFSKALRQQHTWRATYTPKEIYDKLQRDLSHEKRDLLHVKTDIPHMKRDWLYMQKDLFFEGIEATAHLKRHIHSKRDLRYVTKRPITWAKRPITCENKPISYVKSPTSHKKSPTARQKSPTFQEKSPTSHEQSLQKIDSFFEDNATAAYSQHHIHSKRDLRHVTKRPLTCENRPITHEMRHEMRPTVYEKWPISRIYWANSTLGAPHPLEQRFMTYYKETHSLWKETHLLKKRSKTCYKETSYMIKRPIACENRPITHAKRSLTCYKETYSLWKETYYKWKDFFLFREYWAISTLSALRLFYLVFLSIKSEKSPISNPKRAPFHMKRVIRRRKETYFVRVLSQQHTVSATSTQKEICDTSKRHLLHV